MAWVYLMEFIVESRQTVVGMTHMMTENALLLGMVFYFDVISKTWVWLVLFGTIGEAICLIATIIFIPESPKFLIMQRRFNEAAKTLNYVATINQKLDFSFTEEEFETFTSGSACKAVLSFNGNEQQDHA